MNPLRELVSRTMLFPALRLMRAQMKLISDPLLLRAMAARADALGLKRTGWRTTAVMANAVPA